MVNAFALVSYDPIGALAGTPVLATGVDGERAAAPQLSIPVPKRLQRLYLALYIVCILCPIRIVKRQTPVAMV